MNSTAAAVSASFPVAAEAAGGSANDHDRPSRSTADRKRKRKKPKPRKAAVSTWPIDVEFQEADVSFDTPHVTTR